MHQFCGGINHKENRISMWYNIYSVGARYWKQVERDQTHHNKPVNTQCHNNVVTTSLQRRDVVTTLWRRCVFAGEKTLSKQYVNSNQTLQVYTLITHPVAFRHNSRKWKGLFDIGDKEISYGKHGKSTADASITFSDWSSIMKTRLFKYIENFKTKKGKFSDKKKIW